jgi:hypothetical protein
VVEILLVRKWKTLAAATVGGELIVDQGEGDKAPKGRRCILEAVLVLP